MTPFFLLKAASSMKKETILVLVVLAVVLILPTTAVATMTNLSTLNGSDARLYTGTASTTNTYDYGYCTFWAAKRREEVGKPIPNTFGNANTWDERAFLSGYLVDQTPAVHAIMQSDQGDLGHVAFVESIAPDGSWTISEMNVKGWDILSSRTFTAAQAKDYKFIH